jgi:recombinational DNA repair ATPase RecF
MTVRSATSALLLEREQTLDALDSLATLASEATGSFVVLEGEAGMGKTSVLERAIQVARERGMQVLSARGSELEQHHPLGVVTSLFESTTRHGESE